MLIEKIKKQKLTIGFPLVVLLILFSLIIPWYKYRYLNWYGLALLILFPFVAGRIAMKNKPYKEKDVESGNQEILIEEINPENQKDTEQDGDGDVHIPEFED